MVEKLNNNIYKIYQLMEFFTVKHSFNNVMVKELIKANEVWLSNEKNNDFNIIRISISSLDETFSDKERIENFINVVTKSFKVEPKFLDIHISNETVSENEIFNTICLNTEYYSGINVENSFPLIKNVVHEADNAESELSNRIASINNNLKQRFKFERTKIKNKFNLTATNVIIIICSILFLANMFLSIKGYSLSASFIVLGADYKMFTLGLKEFYRLFTYGFVHSSFIHLLLNMYSLYILGNLIENKYGSFKFIIILFSSILIGGLTHGILTDNQLIVGMSGGIYGLFAIYIIEALNMGAYNNTSFLMMLFINLGLNFISNVSWQTHLGGAIAGLMFYFIFKNKKIDYTMLALFVITLVALFYKYITLTNISPLYLGTDSEVVKIFDDFGFKNISTNLYNKLYNYYMNH